MDIELIMDTPGVIRSRRKIEAVIRNARCVQQIRKEFGSFSEYLWSWTNGKMLLYRGHEPGNIPASNGVVRPDQQGSEEAWSKVHWERDGLCPPASLRHHQ